MITAKKVRRAMEASGGRNRLVSFRFIGISENKSPLLHRLMGWLPVWPQWLASKLIFAGAQFANRILPGYVTPNDAGKYEMVFDHDGPTSYINASLANSGDQINALDLGVGGFESVGVDSLVNASGVVAGTLQSVVEVSLGSIVTTNTGIPFGASAVSSLVLHWFESATRGTEFPAATNLSSAFTRLRVMCV